MNTTTNTTTTTTPNPIRVDDWTTLPRLTICGDIELHLGDQLDYVRHMIAERYGTHPLMIAVVPIADNQASIAVMVSARYGPAFTAREVAAEYLGVDQ